MLRVETCGLGFIVFLGCLDPFSPDSLLYLGLHRRPSSLLELGLPGRPSSLLELGLPRTRGPDSLLVLGLHRSPSSLLELGLPGRPSSLRELGLRRRRGSSRRFGCLGDRAALVRAFVDGSLVEENGRRSHWNASLHVLELC